MNLPKIGILNKDGFDIIFNGWGLEYHINGNKSKLEVWFVIINVFTLGYSALFLLTFTLANNKTK